MEMIETGAYSAPERILARWKSVSGTAVDVCGSFAIVLVSTWFPLSFHHVEKYF